MPAPSRKIDDDGVISFFHHFAGGVFCGSLSLFVHPADDVARISINMLGSKFMFQTSALDLRALEAIFAGAADDVEVPAQDRALEVYATVSIRKAAKARGCTLREFINLPEAELAGIKGIRPSSIKKVRDAAALQQAALTIPHPVL